MVERDVNRPAEITVSWIRAFIAEMLGRKLSDSYVHIHARTIRTFMNFLYNEKYIPDPVKFKLPKIEEKRLLCLNAEQVETLIKACDDIRDKALILLMVDTGLRREEVCQLDWEDVDITSGVVRVDRGKGGKARSVVVGVTTRRALLAYRRELNMPAGPLFVTRDGLRFLPMGLRAIFQRLTKKTGIKVTPHSLRRTFATMSLRAGMNPIHLQGLLGHSTLDMTRRYIQMVDDDLVEAHKLHGPIDNILKRR
jgi:site-specific recombinase XerD